MPTTTNTLAVRPPSFLSLSRCGAVISRCIRLLLVFLLLTTSAAQAQKQMERLNRGVVAVRISASQVFVSWRLFGTDDPATTSFHVYRNGSRITTTTISTNYIDNNTTLLTLPTR